MKSKTIFKLGALLVVLTMVLSVAAFAQTTWYVNNTNGDDLVFNGQSASQPYKTIAKAIASAASGDIISIAADTYTEATVSVTKSLTFASTTFNGLNTVTVANGITVNPGSTGTVNLGRTSDGSLAFNLGTTATALTLTSGALNVSTANVTIGSLGTVTRSAGTLNENLTTTNVNVTYTGTSSIAAGPELPASIGTGVLTVNLTAAAATLTVAGNVGVSGATGSIVMTGSGSASFGGVVTATSSATNVFPGFSIDHNGTGTMTFSNAIAFARGGTTTTANAFIRNNSTGTLTLTSGVSAGTGTAVNLSNVSTGTVNVGGGTFSNTTAATAAIVNDAGGTVNFTANTTVAASISNNNAASVLKLNSNTLTMSGTGVTLTNAGKVISDLASTVGSGTFAVTGSLTANGGGDLPNVTVSGSGTLTLGATTILFGNYTQTSAAAGALTFGANTMDVKGNWTRSSNSPGDVTAGTGTLQFTGTGNQTFTPGASLTLYNIVVNKTTGTVVMAASVVVGNNVTITSGGLDLGDFNLRLSGTGTFTNAGSFYSTSGNGYVIFEGTGGTMTGTGTFGNTDIRVGSANTVTGGSAMSFSGTLYLRSGTLAMGANTLTITSTTQVPVPAIYRSMEAATAVITGTVAVGSGSKYDLFYFDATTAANARTAGPEWVAAGGIRNLSVVSTPSTNANALTGPAAGTTITGSVTVAAGQTLNLNAQILTASGSVSHSIVGSTTNGTLALTGTTVTVTGSTVTANAALVNNLSFEPPNAATGATLTVTDLKQVSGNLTILATSTAVGVTANITFAAATATIGGNYSQGNVTVGPSVTLGMNSTASTHTGNLTVTKGSLTYTRNGGAAGTRTVGGNVSLANTGSMTLGSNVDVTGTTTQANTASLDLGAFNYTAAGAFTRSGTGAISATTGKLVLAYGASAAFTPGASLTLVNLEVISAANTVTLTGNGVTVSGTFTFTSGTFDFNALALTVSGNMTYTAGTFTATGGGGLALTGAATTVTMAGNLATVGTLTINSTGTVTFISSDETASTPTARTVTVAAAFTQTAGNINLGRHSLVITSTFTRAAGNWTQTTGYLRFNNAALSFVTGTGLEIDNLDIQANATNAADNKTYTVKKNLLLTAGTLTQGATGKLILADGATITVSGGALAAAPTFPASPGMVNLVYTVTVTTSVEFPSTATVVKDLTINGAGITVTLQASRTVNGTLYLQNGTLTVPTTFSLTLGAGGTYKVTSAGVLTLAGTATFSTTTYHLEYTGTGAITTTNTEFPTASTKILSLTISTSTGATVTLNSDKTLNSHLVINATGTGAGLKLSNAAETAWYALTVKGNVTLTAGGFVTPGVRGAAGTTRPRLIFAGTASQTLTVPSAGYAFFSGVDATATPDADVDDAGDTPAFDIVVNNTATADADKYVATAGGNVTMGAFGVVRFTSGIIYTGSAASPYQFVWTLIQGNSGATNQPTQGFDRSGVSSTGFGHFVGNVKKFVNNSTGTSVDRSIVTFPVGTAASSPGNYRPASFYFKTAPQSAVNVTVAHLNTRPGGANGYPISAGGLTITNYPNFSWYVKSDISIAPSYQFDMEAQAEGYVDYLGDQIQNVRFVRRDSGSVNNQWVLQKNNTTGTILYDNSTIAANWPVVKVIDATGGITTQGSLFTYSQNNKAPLFTAALGNVIRNEGDTLSFTYVASDPDLNDVATLSAVTIPTGATFNAGTGAFSWVIPYDVATSAAPTATRTVTIRATDTYGPLSKDTTITVSVNNVNRGPVFTAVAAKTITDKDTLSVALSAADLDGDAVTYSFVSITPAASANPTVSSAGALVWDPAFADAGQTYSIRVAASDGSLTDSLSISVTVNRSRIRGDVSGDGTISAFDASLVLQHVTGIAVITDAAALYAADASANGTVSAFDAALILQHVAGLYVIPPAAMPENQGLRKVDGSAFNLSPAGSVSWSSPAATEVPEVISMGLKTSADASGIYSIEVTSAINEALVSVEGITTKLPADWQVSHNVVDGELKIAMAGLTPIAGGEFATVSFRLKDNTARLNLSTSSLLNERESSVGAVEIAAVPTVFQLEQNYPNPFNPSTTIKYQLPQEAGVTLSIYNLQGQKVRTLVSGDQKAGFYSVQWDGRNDAGASVSTGLYIYRIHAGTFTAIHKMLLMK